MDFRSAICNLRFPGLVCIAILGAAALGIAIIPAMPSSAGEPALRSSPREEAGAVLSREEYLFDFETDADYDAQPDNWFRIIDENRMPWVSGSLEPRKPYGRAYAITLNHAPAALETRLFLRIDRTATYVLTGEVSARNMGESEAWVEVRFFNKLLEPIKESELATVTTEAVTNTGNAFLVLEKTFGPLPEEAFYVKVRCVLDGREKDYDGKCIFDNIKLKPYPAIRLVPDRRIFRLGAPAALELRFAGLRPGKYTGEKGILDWLKKPLAKPQKLQPQEVTAEETLEPELVALPTDRIGFFYFSFILRRDGNVILNMLEPFLVVEDDTPMRTKRFGVMLPDEAPSTKALLTALDNLGIGVVSIPFDIYHLDDAEARRDQLQALGKKGYERVGFLRLTHDDKKQKEHRTCDGVLDCLFKHESTIEFVEKNFRAFGDSIEGWLLAHPLDPSITALGSALTGKDEKKLAPIVGRLKKASPWTSLGTPFPPPTSARLAADIAIGAHRFGAVPPGPGDISAGGASGAGNASIENLRKWAVVEFPQQGADISRDAMIAFARQIITLHASGTDTILVDPLWGDGLFGANWKMRPPIAVYRAIVHMLGEHEPSPLRDPITGKELHLGPDVESFYFHTGDEYVLAVWTDKRGGARVTGFWGNRIAWSDIWGETRGRWGLAPVPGAEGKFREDPESRFVPGAKHLAEFHVVREPRFITGIDVPLIKTQLSLQFVPDNVMPRKLPQPLTLRLKNFYSHEIRGRLRILESEPTKDWEFSKREFLYTLAPGATWTGSFEVAVPSTALSGKRHVSISFSTSKPGELTEHEVSVERELEITRLVDIAIERDRKTDVVRLTLTNITHWPLALNAYTGLHGYVKQENSINLNPGGKTSFDYVLPELLRVRGQNIRVHLVEKRGDRFQNDEFPLQ